MNFLELEHETWLGTPSGRNFLFSYRNSRPKQKYRVLPQMHCLSFVSVFIWHPTKSYDNLSQESLEPFQNTAIAFSLQKIPCSFRVSLNLTSPLKRGQFLGTSIEIFSSGSKTDFKFFASKTVSNSFSSSSESLLYCYIYKLFFVPPHYKF